MNPTPTPQPFPPCDAIVGDLVGCCTVTLPNASTWVVCADPGGAGQEAASIPSLSGVGALLFVVLLVAVAVRRLRS